MKSKLSCLLLLVFMCLPVWGGNTIPPAPQLSGSFNITGYLEPALISSYTYCFNFTTTGGVLGYPNSGTWNVPSYSLGWSGEWYQTGDELIFHGVADGIYIFSWKGRLINAGKISGRQVEFFIAGNTDTAGTFFGSKISGSCPAGVSKTGDPAR